MQTKNTPAKSATKRQMEVLSFLDKFIRKYSYPPSRTEIAEHFEFNQNSVTGHLGALIDKGYIERVADRARALSITAKGKRALREQIK